MKTENSCPGKDIDAIVALTPFSTEDLNGQQFKNGNILGGAHPLVSTAPASWENTTSQD